VLLYFYRTPAMAEQHQPRRGSKDALLIHVVGGEHTSTSSVPNPGVLLYFLLNTCNGGEHTPTTACYFYRTPAMAELQGDTKQGEGNGVFNFNNVDVI
jgi:hypothetical protein